MSTIPQPSPLPEGQHAITGKDLLDEITDLRALVRGQKPVCATQNCVAAIPQQAPPLDDVRLVAARQALAELPDVDDNERPDFWLGRLRVHLEVLTAAWPTGVPGGLDPGQREVLGQALADALEYRTPTGACEDCDVRPEGLCTDHAADLDLTDAYIALARELGIEVPR